MKQIECRGDSFAIGLAHGKHAQPEIERSVAFYAAYFLKIVGLQWDEIIKETDKYIPFLETNAPELLQEIKGVAQGSGKQYLEILALNIRTEIAFGLRIKTGTDGCTSLSYRPDANTNILGQNWDWNYKQQPNLVALTIVPDAPGSPKIKMVTEAGIIGKIGYNEFGVGVCLNALLTPGVDYNKWPIHLALRKALTFTKSADALSFFEKAGCASSAHILISGRNSVAAGMEFTCKGMRVVQPDADGNIVHTNNFVLEPYECPETIWLKDSIPRRERGCLLIKQAKGFDDLFSKLLSDTENSPCAILRTDVEVRTLFTILMDLNAGTSVVRVISESGIQSQFDFNF